MEAKYALHIIYYITARKMSCLAKLTKDIDKLKKKKCDFLSFVFAYTNRI